MAREQHQPNWNSPADKVACLNNKLKHADFSSQLEMLYQTAMVERSVPDRSRSRRTGIISGRTTPAKAASEQP